MNERWSVFLKRLESGGDEFRSSIATPLPQARLLGAQAPGRGTDVFLKETGFY